MTDGTIVSAEAWLSDLEVETVRTDAVQSFLKQETIFVRLRTAGGAEGLGYSYTIGTGGRAVPEDMSIVALCPDHIAEQTAPRLTSVTIPAAELGTRAVDLLMRRMDDGAPSEVQLIPPALTVRGSTGPRRTSPVSEQGGRERSVDASVYERADRSQSIGKLSRGGKRRGGPEHA